ncbi:MAG: ABC transporter substrate-binding protein [Thermomicrobiales bacterium]
MSQRINRRHLVGGAAAAALSAHAARGVTGRAQRERTPDSIVIGALRDAKTINPFLTDEAEGDWRCKMLFDEFVRANPETYVPEPGLAAEWAIDDVTFTFKLQPDARFADGSTVTADDVAFTIKGHLAKATGSPRQVRFMEIAGAEEFVDGTADDVSGIEVVDPATLRITLARDDAAFLFNLRYVFVVPQAQLASKNLANDPWFDRPVGAGPFVINAWERGANFIATKNPHYWQPNKPAIAYVVQTVLPDADSLINALIDGAVDASNWPPMAAKERLDQDPRLSAFVAPFNAPNGWMFNCAHEWLGKEEIRKAIATALDTRRFVDTALLGLSEPGNGPIAPSNWAYDPELAPIEHDVEAARELIVASSMPRGTKIRFMVNEENAVRRDWLAFTETALADLGVEITPEVIPYEELLVRVTETRDYDACGVDFVGVTAEPSRLYDQFHTDSPGNYMNYSSGELDVVLAEVREQMDLEQARVAYKLIQTTIIDEVPAFFAWYRPRLHVVAHRFANYTDSAAFGLFHILEDWTVEG